ncbi:TetR/AcrR family transcriptional regulator [Nocardia vaccinii]|uniref:TetR/AcrR family transcriptional regulator n=1 Tax=Nocardia vaccinii TaxID=1822 RepID=UPI000835ECC4|nr:TetR/AcrR family transcriptional regulator [Nocardia vaccinii]
MSKTAGSPASTGLPGRKAQAARNDGIILEAAREVFLDDASAPIAAVAERAGVGISALYRRYPSKAALLHTLCYNGLCRFNAEAEAALENSDDWEVLVDFLHRVVDADVHSLTVRLAGTFTPGDEILPEVNRSGELSEQIIDRARRSGRLRRQIGTTDLGLILESCAAITHPDPRRATQLRHRVLRVIIDGLTVDSDLPGPPPEPGEFAYRWAPRG